MAADEIIYQTQHEAILAAMVETRATGGTVFVCRGAAIGCERAVGECESCYRISEHDRRTADEHVAAFGRRDC